MRLLFIIALLGLYTFTYAQQAGGFQKPPLKSGKGRIAGRVIDSATKTPIEFATISLFRLPDSTLKDGITTNELGVFSLDVDYGKYYLKVAFVGFKNKRVDSIEITEANPEKFIRGIALKGATSKNLKEVTVTAEQDLVKNEIDRKTYNVEKDVLSKGGSATDVLQNVPSVTFDSDGNLNLRGNSNVTILIDGKPSGLNGIDKQALLNQIPASTIEKIEVITNPSARYDADGTGGILNVVLKKSTKPGQNGSVSIGAGTREFNKTYTINKYNTSASYNLRYKKINLTSNLTYNIRPTWNKGYTDRTTTIRDTSYYLSQQNAGENNRTTLSGRLGVEYHINDKNTVGINGNATQANGLEFDEYNYDYQNYLSQSYQNVNRVANAVNKNKSTSGNAFYKHNFSTQGHDLSVDITYEENKQASDRDFFQKSFLNTTNGLTITNQRNATGYQQKNFIGQFDYQLPLKDNKGKVEAGLKYTNRVFNSQLQATNYNNLTAAFDNDTNITGTINYNENINAVYSNYANTFGKYSLQAGLRVENSIVSGSLTKTRTASVGYNIINLFPSVFLKRNIALDKDLTLNYSRRIKRPDLQQLIPFPDYTDPTTLRTGNPSLRPEFINSFELGYALNKEKINVTTTVYYKNTQQAMYRLISVTEANKSVVTFANIAQANSVGNEWVVRNNWMKGFTTTLNVNLFYNTLKAEFNNTSISNKSFIYFVKFNTSITLPYAMQLQLSANYNSPVIIPQGKLKPNFMINTGLKKDLWNYKASIALNLSDITNGMFFGIDSKGSNFSAESIRKRESRIFFLTFTYNFGKEDIGANRKKKGKEQREDAPVMDNF